jgi:hypothetical protein
MKHLLALVLVVATFLPLSAAQAPSGTRAAVFVAYYWRARPDKAAEYSDYIKNVAEKIDEDARKAGVFEEVRTVTPAPGVTTDWTHLRIFRLKDARPSRHWLPVSMPQPRE